MRNREEPQLIRRVAEQRGTPVNKEGGGTERNPSTQERWRNRKKPQYTRKVAEQKETPVHKEGGGMPAA